MCIARWKHIRYKLFIYFLHEKQKWKQQMLFSAAGSSSLFDYRYPNLRCLLQVQWLAICLEIWEYAPLINITKWHDDLNWRPGNNLSDVVSTSVHIPIIFAKGTDTRENQWEPVFHMGPGPGPTQQLILAPGILQCATATGVTTRGDNELYITPSVVHTRTRTHTKKFDTLLRPHRTHALLHAKYRVILV